MFPTADLCCNAVFSLTSTRLARHRSAITRTVGAAAGAASVFTFGTRIDDSSPLIQSRRCLASFMVRNVPPYNAFDSRPPTRYLTR
jgi:hypothetical protein